MEIIRGSRHEVAEFKRVCARVCDIIVSYWLHNC